MRIVFLTKRFPPECCGVGDFTWRLAETLAAHGHQVSVVTQPHAGPRPTGIRVVGVPLAGWRDIAKVVRSIREQQPERVQLEYSSYAWGRWGFAFWVNALLLALRSAGLPVTIAFHELYIWFKPNPALILVSLIQRLHVIFLALSASEIVVNTPDRLAWMRRWLPWRRGRIHYRPNASNIPVALSNRREETRAARCADPKTLVVATFGNFASAKNYEAVIEAMALVRETRAVQLWLLGDWSSADAAYVARLRETVRRLGIEQEVYWSGRAEATDISTYLQGADIFVLPQSDGHLTRSGAFMAAAAHGLSVIAVRNPREQVEFKHAENVWLVARSRAEEFAAAICALADNAALRGTMGRRLRILYSEHFSWENMAALLAPKGAAQTDHAAKKTAEAERRQGSSVPVSEELRQP